MAQQRPGPRRGGGEPGEPGVPGGESRRWRRWRRSDQATDNSGQAKCGAGRIWKPNFMLLPWRLVPDGGSGSVLSRGALYGHRKTDGRPVQKHREPKPVSLFTVSEPLPFPSSPSALPHPPAGLCIQQFVFILVASLDFYSFDVSRAWALRHYRVFLPTILDAVIASSPPNHDFVYLAVIAPLSPPPPSASSLASWPLLLHCASHGSLTCLSGFDWKAPTTSHTTPQGHSESLEQWLLPRDTPRIWGKS